MADDIKRADELLEAKADDNDFFRLGGGQHKFDLQSFAARNGVAANNVSAAYNGENSAESQEHKDFELLNIVILQTSLSRLYESLRDLKKTLETVRESLRVLRLQEHILLEDMRHNLEQQRDIRFDLQNLNKALEKKEHEIVAQRDVVSDLKSEVEKASHKTEKTRGEALPLQDRVMAYEQTLKNTDLITLDGPEVGDLQVVWQDERGHYFVDSPCGEILVVERDKLAEIKRQTAQGKITADRAPSGLKKQIQDFQDLQGQFQVSEGEYVECHKDELGLRTDLLFAQERLENLIRKRDEISEEIKEKQALLLWLEKKSMVDKKQLDEIRDNIHKLEKNERDLLKKIEKKEEEIRELEEKLPPGSQASIGEEPRETDLLNPLAPAPSPALIDRHKDGIAAIIEAAGGSMDRSALATLSARYGIEGSALDLLISELDGKNGLSITAPASRNEPAGCSFAYGIDPYPPGGGLQLCLSPVFEKCSEVLETETPKPETAPSPVPKPLLAHQITGIS